MNNKDLSIIIFTCALFFIGSQKAKGQSINDYQGSVNVEFSVGLTGYAKDYSYKSIGLATGYGKKISNSSYIGIGVKPNYIFSAGDFDGFFLPVYGEYKYHPISEAGVSGFGNARLGYSPISKMGMYAHLGGGIIIYQKWELGFGVSYQYAKFTETRYDEIDKLDYNLVFATLSVGYRF